MARHALGVTTLGASMHGHHTRALWDRILSAARARGIALQKELAAAAGMDAARLSALKTTNRVPHPGELAGLARALGTTPELLTEGLKLPPSIRRTDLWTKEDEKRVATAYKRLRATPGSKITIEWLRSVAGPLNRKPGAIAVRLSKLGFLSPREAGEWQKAIIADNRRARARSGHQKAATVVRARDGCCVLCGGTEKLDAHHIEPFHRSGTSKPEEMVLLCDSCHHRLHRGLSKDEAQQVSVAFSRATGVAWTFSECAKCGAVHLHRAEAPM